MGKSLVLHETPSRITNLLLHRIKNANINIITNLTVQSHSLEKNDRKKGRKLVDIVLVPRGTEEEESSGGQGVEMRSDVLFRFEDEQTGSKQYSYYKTIIDGKIKNDENYEEFFTIYMKPKGRKREDVRE